MRDIVVKIGGADVSLRGTFGAAEEVMRHIGDPIALIKENHLASAIPAYQPKLSLTVANIPVVLWIGAKSAGDKRSLDEWKAVVFDAGYIECMEPAMAYILHITTSQSQREAAPSEGATAGE